MRRQLEPPKEMITNTRESQARKRPHDPIEAEEWDRKRGQRLFKIMSKKDRARQLMDQKATSVADLAFVLQLQDNEIVGERLERKEKERLENRANLNEATPEELEKLDELKKTLAAKEEKQAKLSNAEIRRKRRAEKEAISHRKKINARIKQLEWQIGQRTDRRVVIMRRSPIRGDYLNRGNVVVLWKDTQDRLNAREWPSQAIHHESALETELPLDNHMQNRLKGNKGSSVISTSHFDEEKRQKKKKKSTQNAKESESSPPENNASEQNASPN